MHVLYIFKSFPGAMGPLARHIAANTSCVSVFMAEGWQRDAEIPGVKKVRIPAVEMQNPRSEKGSARMIAESRLAHHIGQAEKAHSVFVRLHKGGIRPDVIYTTPEDGYALYAKDVFPAARLIFRLESFNHRGAARHGALSADVSAPLSGFLPPLSPLLRLHNANMLCALEECDTAITSSAWQRSLFPEWSRGKIQIVRNGVDTSLFAPSPCREHDEIVVFSCHRKTPLHDIACICKALPALLASRPLCQVRLLFFAKVRAEEEKQQIVARLEKELSVLEASQRQRVAVCVSPSQSAYVALLQRTTVYVYLVLPTMLTAGILEAMSCGAVVLASDTGPVRDIVRHGENGFVADLQDAQGLAQALTAVLAQDATLMGMRQSARATILAEYDIRKNLACHAGLLLDV